GVGAPTLQPAPNPNRGIIYLSQTGWSLPDSKHNFSDNGYRTRLLVFDPRTTNQVPNWLPSGPQPPPYESPGLAHSTDLLPTILGFALGTPGPQACPPSRDGTPCDGRDLRPFLRPAGAVQSPLSADALSQPPLRHALR